ncbi:MAG TPA: Uma2 family endonuclease [Fimbriiglobus sp.]|nr:Uma2 family endonuclease [Fimbriiglobus sp.]
MSTATIHTSGQAPPAPTPTGASSRRLLTAADLALFPKSLPSGDVRWELFNGELLPMSPPGYGHGKATLQFVAQLWLQGQQKGLGQATDEVGVILRRNPDRVVGPDALFVMSKSLPVKLSPEGYLETIPELVVEVRSKNDTGPEVEAKVREYLAAGVELVWVADPDARTVTAHRPNQPAQVYAAADTLTADPVIPGFAVPVAELFRT